MSSSMAPVEIVVVSKKTAVTKYGMPTDFRLEDGGVVQIQATRAQVKDLARVGKDLVVTLQNGETITVRDYFAPLDGGQSHVVLQDDAEGLWLVELGAGEGPLPWGYSSLYSIDSLMTGEQANSSIPIVAIWGGMAGLLAVGSASTHNASQKPSPAVLHPVNGVKPITGTAEPGATVIVSFPGGGSHTAVVGADGKFSVPNPGLKDGDKVTVVVSHHGAESNPVVITVDALAPANPVVHPVNATHPITGTAEPGSTVTVTFPDGSQKTAVAGKDGHFEVPNPGMLTDGQPVKVTATDPAGNVSGEVITKVDAVAPPVPTVNPVNGHDPITGTAEPGAVVTVVLDNGKTITGVAGADGYFSLPNPGTMKDGDVIRVSATDAAGNTGPSATVTIDASAPLAPKLNPVNGKDPITGEAEPHSTIKVTLPDGTTAVAEAGADGKFRIPNPGLEDGASLKVVSVDAAGNVSEPVIVVVDARAPAPPQVDLVNGHEPITGHAEPGSTVTVTYPDGSTSTTKVGDDGSFSIPNPGGLESGQILVVVATDAAGNTSDPIKVPIFQEEPVPVPAPIVNPANALDPITGTAVPGSKVTVTLPDHSQVEGHADEHGHFSVAHPDMVLKDGDVIVVQVSDADGNTSDPVRVTIDAVAPTTPTIDPVNAVDPITGTAEPGSKVTVTFPDGQSQTVVAGPDGHFSMANPGLEDGKAITVTATDAAGNVSGEATITVDGIAPVLTITDDVDGIVGKDGHVTFTFTFSEDVKDFDLSDIQVSGGQAGQLVQISPRVYLLEVKPPAGGTMGIIQVSVAAGAVHDAAGNANLGVTAQQAYDLVAPGLDSLSQLELQDDVGDVRGEIKTGMTTDDSTPTYVGKADPAEVARVELLDKGVVIGSAVVNADGSFSVSPDHPITGGGTASRCDRWTRRVTWVRPHRRSTSYSMVSNPARLPSATFRTTAMANG